MFCSNCGKEIRDGVKFCTVCGAPVEQPEAPAPVRKKRKASGGVIAAVIACVLALGAVGGSLWFLLSDRDAEKDREEPASISEDRSDRDEKEDEEQAPEVQRGEEIAVSSVMRPQLLDFTQDATEADPTPSVAPYQVTAGLGNVTNLGQFWLSETELRLLEQNQFVVSRSYYNEFFELYESNRYGYVPNFVTVDSMMHTYHLYFSLLLNRTEKNYLAWDLLDMSRTMLTASQAQYDALTGTEWEAAALKNVAFFAVAAALQDPSEVIPSSVSDIVETELDAVYRADGIETSPVAENFVDYSQFRPRGYYEGDEVLEAYFRAMMWYGQINFTQDNETLNRSALLMTLAMEEHAFRTWEEIYLVTSFFAGTSDDLGYYEYAPAIETAYGTMPTVDDLAADSDSYETFAALVSEMQPPAINSVPVWDGTEDIAEITKGFRFMGQRFTIDAAVMQKLVYSNVEATADNRKRMLPDVLDMPAALGSDLALELLEQQGAVEFPGYLENMEQLRTTLENASEESWTTSLYSSWLYTLSPLLEVKGEGYPSFMTSTEWQKKALETYAGSFTELKHDTVLYAKQVMAEMGGGPPEELDDRGYVEPETEVYRRFMLLAQQTAEGLDRYGLISDEDRENLSRLGELAQRLLTISQKELRDETLTEEEYELIRTYGGTLEHFWTEAVKEKNQSDWLDTKEIPASLVTDIATDPNGTVLQAGNAQPAEILVVVPIDGQLRLASGMVFNFYQFEQPMSQRLTDTEWRQMTGEWMAPEGSDLRDRMPEKPWWTQSYWSE